MSNVKVQLRRMERILEIGRELTSTASLEHLLHKIVGATAELTNSEMGSILLLDEHTSELRFIAASVFPDQLADIPVPIASSIAGNVFSSGKPLIVYDVRNDPRHYKAVDYHVGFETRSLLAVPLQFKDCRIGVLEAENKRGNTEFGPEDVEMLTALAAQATVAIENARSVETLQRARDMANALSKASAALSSTLDYDQVLDHILEQISHVISYDAANVMLITGSEGKVARVVRGRGYERFGTAETLTSTSLQVADTPGLRQMQQTGQALVIPDVEHYDGWVYSRPEHTWIKSYIGAPFRIRDRVLGFLNVLSATRGFFDQADAECLLAFADHVAIAIENARLYRHARQEIVERKWAEEELRRHRDHLEELVEERTVKLRQYTVELEARNQDLDAFAHTVAHDLKSPLGPMLGYAQVLAEDYATLPDEELRGYLHTIVRSGSKMVSIIDELLLLASARQTTDVGVSPLDMAGVVEQVLQRLDYMIAEHQAEIILPETWPVPLGYGPWIEEAWVNYVSNALKYGGRPPRVELGATEQEDGSIRFWVHDNGPGLTPDEQGRLFTPFTRLDQIRAKGHGLGLSIVRRIVERLGGQVGVESQTGQGSVFTFTLPHA
ncbi:MAG: GAF domain-containing protein [Chloroflexi bacterium]|nr:GAF domain-containing protein [Chloroflexota bacterium]